MGAFGIDRYISNYKNRIAFRKNGFKVGFFQNSCGSLRIFKRSVYTVAIRVLRNIFLCMHQTVDQSISQCSIFISRVVFRLFVNFNDNNLKVFPFYSLVSNLELLLK